MEPTDLRSVGQTTVQVTQLGLGTAPLGDLFVTLEDKEASAIMNQAWLLGIRYFDTAPFYGRGLSEHRVGEAVYRRPRSDFVLSTKVGRLLSPHSIGELSADQWAGGLPFTIRFDYTYDGIMRSIADSLQRLRLTRIDLALVHDLDFWNHHPETDFQQRLRELVSGGGWRALAELRDSGVIKGIGLGVNHGGLMRRYLATLDPDFVLLALRYTLLDQSALDEDLPLCSKRGVGVIVGGVFNSGILATGPVRGAKYNYVEAPAYIVERVQEIERVCRSFHVSIGAAAIQFPLGCSLIASVIPGAAHRKELATNVKRFRWAIPDGFWAALKTEGLLRADAPVPNAVCR